MGSFDEPSGYHDYILSLVCVYRRVTCLLKPAQEQNSIFLMPVPSCLRQAQRNGRLGEALFQ